MASPISATIELSRCWTTERVMGSTAGRIFGLWRGTNEANEFYVRFFALGVFFLPDFLFSRLRQTICTHPVRLRDADD
jgi:hypothetical protein